MMVPEALEDDGPCIQTCLRRRSRLPGKRSSTSISASTGPMGASGFPRPAECPMQRFMKLSTEIVPGSSVAGSASQLWPRSARLFWSPARASPYLASPAASRSRRGMVGKACDCERMASSKCASAMDWTRMVGLRCWMRGIGRSSKFASLSLSASGNQSWVSLWPTGAFAGCAVAGAVAIFGLDESGSTSRSRDGGPNTSSTSSCTRWCTCSSEGTIVAFTRSWTCFSPTGARSEQL